MEGRDRVGTGPAVTSEFSIAVHALVYLNHKARALTSEELAKNVCTNPARLRKVLAKLKKAGLVETSEGSRGGCRFVKDPRSVTLEQICSAIGEPIAECRFKTGSIDMECLVASGMGRVMDGIFADLNGLCLERLSGITVKDIDSRIFDKAAETAGGERQS